MQKKTQTPKFLTREAAREAVRMAMAMVRRPRFKKLFPNFDGEFNCHITILVPGMEDDREAGYPKWPNYALQPVPLYEQSFGNVKKWRHPFNDIACCKGLQLWHDRNDGGMHVSAHLLYAGDTPWWGGVKRQGIVVSCSGFDQEIDRLISGFIADILVAQAYAAFKVCPEVVSGSDFLS